MTGQRWSAGTKRLLAISSTKNLSRTLGSSSCMTTATRGAHSCDRCWRGRRHQKCRHLWQCVGRLRTRWRCSPCGTPPGRAHSSLPGWQRQGVQLAAAASPRGRGRASGTGRAHGGLRTQTGGAHTCGGGGDRGGIAPVRCWSHAHASALPWPQQRNVLLAGGSPRGLEAGQLHGLPAQQAPPVGDRGPAVQGALAARRRPQHVRPHALSVPQHQLEGGVLRQHACTGAMGRG